MDITEELIKLGLIALFAGLGAYFGSYLKTKAENLATHEDIAEVLDQVRAVTTTTKEIEAKISNDVWDRQKRWEMKRELLFEATRAISKVNQQLLSLNVVQGVEHRSDDREWLNAFGERARRYADTTGEFEGLTLLMATVCDRETFVAVQEFHVVACALAAKIANGDTTVYSNSVRELSLKANAVRRVFRKELGLDEQS